MSLPVAYHNGSWKPSDQVALTLDDWGSLQGATLVERLRTVNGRGLDIDGHLDRLASSAQIVGIQWPADLAIQLVEECIERNRNSHSTGDFAVVILLTPGRAGVGTPGANPTLIIHTSDLNWKSLAQWYEHGQHLVIANNRNVPADCWSPRLKTRSRLHYYLADQQAARSGRAHAGALMLSTDGYVTESSVANMLLVESRGLVSPPIDSVLHGLSLQRTLRLAEQRGIAVHFEHIQLEHAYNAEAILMTGSSGCLWAAASLEHVHYTNAQEHPIHRELRSAWIEDIGLDFVRQATDISAP